jgi:hypothetical protein
VLVTFCTTPVASSTFLSLPSDGTPKPMNRPSGDQNGFAAPSVPLIRRGIDTSKERTHSPLFPAPFLATKAM